MPIEIIIFAKKEGITNIVLGNPKKEGALAGGIYKELIFQTEGIDKYLITPVRKTEALAKKIYLTSGKKIFTKSVLF